MKTKLLLFFIAFFSVGTQLFGQIKVEHVWSTAKANSWYQKQSWLVGSNYIPATAINQLEMWQADTFDPTTIDKELGWAEGIGFNTMRVFLHSLAYKADPAGFKVRLNQFLTLADKHQIKPMFVFFDDCWNKEPKIGKQPEKKTGIHNSGWVQDPGDPAYKQTGNFADLEIYVKDVLRTFAHDKRVLMWDLYNEPGNSGKLNNTLPLLKNVFAWARAVDPDQPLTSGLWNWEDNFKELNQFQLANSDIISYHCYDAPEQHHRTIEILKLFNRPLVCTEYMARPRNSTIANTLPILKREKVAAINWGFVAGKTNTIYAWDTPMINGDEPKLWFHDIFRSDGSSYRSEETDLIKKLTAKKE